MGGKFTYYRSYKRMKMQNTASRPEFFDNFVPDASESTSQNHKTMKIKAEFIILASTKVGDRSLVLHTLSPEWGRRSFLVGATRQNLAMALPLNIVEAEISVSRVSELWRANALECTQSLNSIRSDMTRGAISMFIAEVLYRTVRDGAVESGLYEWCRSSIRLLDSMESSYANFHLRWLLEFAAVLGFTPDAEALRPFAGELSGQIESLLDCSWAEAMLVPLNGELRNHMAKRLISYISYHCCCEINIRSLDVLHEIFI